ncbi:hypothetical protein BBOV_III010830 [Babesia bovis T2Bo]|uniref:Uncharacterized protein n=1 Tax=Babesia bovis TaxID=5865 RepID=A7AQ01_BABBO|nr:hypothetical protein BBOV_III010830 [Babesia bovis T2Bo]EDO08635.1 hypothetical protein BBOV_III010830 [Babesia bovis T2Bo]|eukprot:XP_001612203.1 hypothetical protein [Babesia bovis T2Bo]
MDVKMKDRTLVTDILDINQVIPEEEHVIPEDLNSSPHSLILDDPTCSEENEYNFKQTQDEGSPRPATFSADDRTNSIDAFPVRMHSDVQTDSGRASFSSTVHSFIGLYTLTKNKLKNRFPRLSTSWMSSSKYSELSESQFSNMTSRSGIRGFKYIGKKWKKEERAVMSSISEDASQAGSTVAPYEGRQETPPSSIWNSMTEHSSSKADVMQKAHVSIKERFKWTSKKAAPKSASKDAISNVPQTNQLHLPTTICYVLSSPKTALSNKLGQGKKNTFNFSFKRNGKLMYLKQKLGNVQKQSNNERAFPQDQSDASKQQSQPVPSVHCGFNCSNVYYAAKRFRFPWNKDNGDDPAMDNMFTVTIVNRGHANMLILKYQSHCKNCLDITPDFGWRRMVEEYVKSGNANSGKRNKVSNEYDELYALRSYMYFRESKKVTHVVGLCELAINIACRAILLGVMSGLIDTRSIPTFLKNLIGKHCGEDYVMRDKHSESVGKVENDGDDVYHPLYVKGGLIGLCVSSSIQSVLDSQRYKDALVNAKRKFRWKMISKQQKEDGTVTESNNNEPDIHTFLPIPDYGWKLVQRSHFDRTFLDNASKSNGRTSVGANLRRLVSKKNMDLLTTTSVYSNAILSKIKPPQFKNIEGYIYSDVGAIGMNIAEQLYRLESKQLIREKLPKNTFGFKVTNPRAAISPCGTKFSVVPEELILNVATMVHEMYMTQPCLMF